MELDFLYPSEGIHRRWDHGFRITSTAATWDQAAFVLSVPRRKLADETQETLRTSAFPSTHVKVGYFINYFLPVCGFHFILLSEGSSFCGKLCRRNGLKICILHLFVTVELSHEQPKLCWDATDEILTIHLYEPQASFYHLVTVQKQKSSHGKFDWSLHMGVDVR